MMQKIWAQHRKARKNNKGFSLVELIIVIAIMAALVAVLAPQYIKYVERSRETGDQNVCSEMLHAVQVAAVDPSLEGTPSDVTFAPAAGDAKGWTVDCDDDDFKALVEELVDVSTVEMKSTDGKEITSLVVVVGDSVKWSGPSQAAYDALGDGVATDGTTAGGPDVAAG